MRLKKGTLKGEFGLIYCVFSTFRCSALRLCSYGGRSAYHNVPVVYSGNNLAGSELESFVGERLNSDCR